MCGFRGTSWLRLVLSPLVCCAPDAPDYTRQRGTTARGIRSTSRADVELCPQISAALMWLSRKET